MNRADDGESGTSEPAQQLDNAQSALCVETRGRFVAKENLWLADDFHSNRHSLSLFGIETRSGCADDGVGKMGQIQEIEDVIHVGELFRVGNRGVLA